MLWHRGAGRELLGRRFPGPGRFPGRALVDRELYLPDGWCGDPARRASAGVPDGVAFATKPALALRMLDRAFAAGPWPAWVLADEVYGNDSKFRRHLEGLGQPFVAAVGCHQRLWVGLEQRRVDAVAAGPPPPPSAAAGG
ncbi:MAG: hypothetical protein JWO31_1202 [Phycisphaerales bacterium]|nr:hypothetical protein [Phycisphaerales bacterium]